MSVSWARKASVGACKLHRTNPATSGPHTHSGRAAPSLVPAPRWPPPERSPGPATGCGRAPTLSGLLPWPLLLTSALSRQLAPSCTSLLAAHSSPRDAFHEGEALCATVTRWQDHLGPRRVPRCVAVHCRQAAADEASSQGWCPVRCGRDDATALPVTTVRALAPLAQPTTPPYRCCWTAPTLGLTPARLQAWPRVRR